MKANRAFTLSNDTHAFSFLIPFTMAIIVSVSLLVVGSYVVGEISTTLEDTFPTITSRSSNQNKTVNLIGNVSDGFADVVDIEIVVMIITGLSMAIFAIMAIGSRRNAF